MSTKKIPFEQEVWETLSNIDLSDYTGKAGNLTYISWQWAWGNLMKHFPQSVIHQKKDTVYPDGTMEVRCEVEVRRGNESVKRSMYLPVMDHKNKAIPNPDAFAINTGRQRCMAKCIAMHGLGFYVYAGEDLPESIQQELKQLIGEHQIQNLMELADAQELSYSRMLSVVGAESFESVTNANYQVLLDRLANRMEEYVAKQEAKEKAEQEEQADLVEAIQEGAEEAL